MSDKKKKCACTDETKEHVDRMKEEDEQKEALDADNETAPKREWEAHTSAYKEAFRVKLESIQPLEDEQTESEFEERRENEMDMWIAEKHPLLCCDHRHKNHLYKLV